MLSSRASPAYWTVRVRSHCGSVRQVAPFLTVGGASNLAEARRLSSPLQRLSPATRRAASIPPRAYEHHHCSSTHCYQLSDLDHTPQSLSLGQRRQYLLAKESDGLLHQVAGHFTKAVPPAVDI